MLAKQAATSFKEGLDQCNALGISLVNRAETMLDVGCGNGNITLQFAKAVGAKTIHGIEYQEELHPLLRSKNIMPLKQDVNEHWEYPDNAFDFVLSSQNIEHVHRTRHYVEECYRVLKPKAQTLIMTENLASFPNIIALLFGWQPFSTTSIEGWIVGNPYAIHANPTKEVGTLQIDDSQFLAKY